MKSNLISTEGVRNVSVRMPAVSEHFHWFEGQEEIVKKTWWGGTKIVQEEISPGWTKYDNPEDQSDILDLSKSYNSHLIERNGQLWDRGEIVIHYKNGDGYSYKSHSAEDIHDYVRKLKERLGESFIEFINN